MIAIMGFGLYGRCNKEMCFILHFECAKRNQTMTKMCAVFTLWLMILIFLPPPPPSFFSVLLYNRVTSFIFHVHKLRCNEVLSTINNKFHCKKIIQCTKNRLLYLNVFFFFVLHFLMNAAEIIF